MMSMTAGWFVEGKASEIKLATSYGICIEVIDMAKENNWNNLPDAEELDGYVTDNCPWLIDYGVKTLVPLYDYGCYVIRRFMDMVEPDDRGMELVIMWCKDSYVEIGGLE